MQTHVTHSPRYLYILQIFYELLLIGVTIGVILYSNSIIVRISDKPTPPPKHASKNPQKIQPAQVILDPFLPEYIATANLVSIEDGFSLPIIQQPDGEGSFVSSRDNLITQFNTPSQYGVTGLLAHNYLSGKEFYNLNIGQKVTVTYKNDIVRTYQVVSINRFQKLDSSSIYSDLIDLDTNKEMSSTEVFNRFYNGAHRVVFQTCLGKDGRLDWGLIFITAEPLNQ